MCNFLAIFAQLETRSMESKHACWFLASLTRLEPTVREELWFGCTGTGVSTGGRAHSFISFFAARTKDSDTCFQGFFFTRMLGSVHNKPPTVILIVSAMRR